MALTRSHRYPTWRQFLPKPPEPEVDYEQIFYNIMSGKFDEMLMKIQLSNTYPTAKELDDISSLLGWLKENYKE